MAPTVICIISRLASSVGLLLLHSSSDCLILSIIGFHGWVWSVLLPIHAPRHLMAVPSCAIFIVFWRLMSSGWSFLVAIILSRCSCVPMGTISVFSMLNLAPDALHHRVRISCSVSYLSFSDRYIVVSSAYRLILMFVGVPGITKPDRLGVFLTVAASGSIARLNSRHDRGSPCRTPLDTW